MRKVELFRTILSVLLGKATGLVGSFLRIMLISSVMFMLADTCGIFCGLLLVNLSCYSLGSEPVAVLRRNGRLIAALGRCV